MLKASVARRDFLRLVTASGAACAVGAAFGNDANDLREPIHRVAKVNNPPAAPAIGAEQHPLDPALEMAAKALKHIQENIVDYSCRIIKQERIRGELQPQEFMDAKIRN